MVVVEGGFDSKIKPDVRTQESRQSRSYGTPYHFFNLVFCGAGKDFRSKPRWSSDSDRGVRAVS